MLPFAGRPVFLTRWAHAFPEQLHKRVRVQQRSRRQGRQLSGGERRWRSGDGAGDGEARACTRGKGDGAGRQGTAAVVRWWGESRGVPTRCTTRGRLLLPQLVQTLQVGLRVLR